MAHAIRLAHGGWFTTHPNPRVGCVIVSDDQVVGEGYHLRAGEPHAEIMALRQAADKARGSLVYVTLEPCAHHGRTPPCAQALIDAGVGEVICAMEDPNPRVAGRGMTMLRQAGIPVRSGLLEQASRRLNPGFIARHECGRPWVRLKSAMSFDGRTALASGESQWITSSEARSDGHRWRAQADVILTGIETVIADRPRMTVRFPFPLCPPRLEAMFQQPRVAVLDSQLRMPLETPLMDRQPLIFTIPSTDARYESRRHALQQRGAEVVEMPAENDRVGLGPVLSWLAAHEFNEMHVEAGPTVTGAFLKSGYFDEWIVYVAATVLGASSRPLIEALAPRVLADREKLVVSECRAIGSDWRWHLIRQGGGQCLQA